MPKFKAFVLASAIASAAAFVVTPALAQNSHCGHIVDPASNDPQPGRAHTNMHIYVPCQGHQPPAAKATPPQTSAPQDPSATETKEPYVPAGTVHSAPSNKPAPGHAGTNIEIFVPADGKAQPPAPLTPDENK